MTGNQKQLVGFPFLSCQEHFLFITVHLKKGEEGTLVEFKKTESHTDSCQVSCPSVTLMCPFIWLSPNCLHREHLLGTKKSVSFPTKLPVYWEATLPRSLQKNYSTICNRGFISFSFSCWIMKGWSESRSVVSDSLRPHGLYSPWNCPGQNTGVGNLSLLQGIFPTQGSNPGLPHCRQILSQLSHKGAEVQLPIFNLEWKHLISIKTTG